MKRKFTDFPDQEESWKREENEKREKGKCRKTRSRREVRLYNVIFPIWMLFLFIPELWLLVAAANFVIDSLVVYFGLSFAGARDQAKRKTAWKKSIVRVFLFGFLSDFIGAAALTVLFIAAQVLLPDLLSNMTVTTLNPFTFPGCILFALPGVILAGLLIYWFNRKFSFRKCKDVLSAAQIRKISFYLAVLTAPYVMGIPMF